MCHVKYTIYMYMFFVVCNVQYTEKILNMQDKQHMCQYIYIDK